MEFADYCLLKTREKALKLAKEVDIREGLMNYKGFKPATTEGESKITV